MISKFLKKSSSKNLIREGLKKKIVEFSTKGLTPPPLRGKKIKNEKNDLYNMGPLTLVRWPL